MDRLKYVAATRVCRLADVSQTCRLQGVEDVSVVLQSRPPAAGQPQLSGVQFRPWHRAYS